MEIDQNPPRAPLYQQVWFAPLVGLLMFALGSFAGFLARPLIESQETEVATVPSLPSPEPGQSGNQQVMSFLIEETRHYKGDPNAPVTMIEFSDFK